MPDLFDIHRAEVNRGDVKRRFRAAIDGRGHETYDVLGAKSVKNVGKQSKSGTAAERRIWARGRRSGDAGDPARRLFHPLIATGEDDQRQPDPIQHGWLSGSARLIEKRFVVPEMTDVSPTSAFQQGCRVLQRRVGFSAQHSRDLFLTRFTDDFAQARVGPSADDFLCDNELSCRRRGHLR